MPDRFVFIPGAAGRASFWDPVIDSLRGHLPTLSPHAVDWPGVGGNPSDRDVASYAALTDLVEAMIERIGPVVLVAQSAGGAVALDLALRRPDLITHLALCATSLGLDVEALGAVDWRPPPDTEPDPERPAWVYERLADRTAELHQIGQPTLLVWAERDRLSPGAVGRHLATNIADAELVVHDSDDHWIAQTEATDVARRLAALAAR